MDSELKNLTLMQDADQYNHWMYSQISPYVGNTILKIGSGLGTITKLIKNKKLVVGTDISDSKIDYLKQLFQDKDNFNFLNINVAESLAGLENHNFDTVMCVNVLEHIKEDVVALRNMNKLLDKKGKLLLVVPALPSIYGSIDKADRHFRRYNKKNLLPKIRKSGFKILKIKYMNLPGVFGWIWHGKILKLKVHKKGDVNLFNKMVPTIKKIESKIQPLFGLSLICIGEKK